MKAFVAFALALATSSACADAKEVLSPPVAVEATVCFTPQQDCESFITEAIAGARKDIHLQAYYLTSTLILRALRDAIARGVTVEAIIDRVNARKDNGSAHYLELAGASVWIDESVTIAHSKLIIIDAKTVIGGSFNYSRSAQDRNAENVTVIDSEALAATFLDNWVLRRDASTPLANYQR